jgi:hypothetical protein
MRNVNLALFAIVEPKWLTQAYQEFRQGQKEEIQFGTKSTRLGPALKRPIQDRIRYIYFKIQGENCVIARATLARVSREKNPSKVLSGTETEPPGKYYYDFRDLEPLVHRIPLSRLKHRNGKIVRNDIPGACVIQEPLPTSEA